MPTLLLALLLPLSHAAEIFVRGTDMCATGLNPADATAEVCYRDLPLDNVAVDLVDQIKEYNANLDEKGEIKDSASNDSKQILRMAAGIGLSTEGRTDLLAKYASLRVVKLAADEEHATKSKTAKGEDSFEIPFLAKVAWATADAPTVQHEGFVAGRVISAGVLNMDEIPAGSPTANELFSKLVRVDALTGEGLTKEMVLNTIAPAVLADYIIAAFVPVIDAMAESLGRALGSVLGAPAADAPAAPAPAPAPTVPAPVAPPSL